MTEEELGDTKFLAVVINNRDPMSCMMGSCTEEERLYENWQQPLREGAGNLTVIQDGVRNNAWNMFGCGHDDLLVYDKEGRLFRWLPSRGSAGNVDGYDFDNFMEQNLMLKEGRDNLERTLRDAAAFDPKRCYDESHEKFHQVAEERTAFIMKGEYVYGTALLIFCFGVMYLGYKYSEKLTTAFNNRSGGGGVKFMRLNSEEEGEDDYTRQRGKKKKRGRHKYKRKKSTGIELPVITEDDVYLDSKVDNAQIEDIKLNELREGMKDLGLDI